MMDRYFFVIAKRKCLVLSFLAAVLRPVNVQFMYPAPLPQLMPSAPALSPQVLAYQPSPQVPVMQVGVPKPIKVVITEQQDVNKQSALAFPVPMPMPMQIGVPAAQPDFCMARQRPPGCPPCPPCLCAPTCTPAFFSYCSPCHLKCRCRDGMQPPIPLPISPPIPAMGPAYPLPVPGPASAVIVPIPPGPPPRYHYRPRRIQSSDSSCDSCDKSSSDRSSSSDSSSDFDFARRSGSRKRKFGKRFNRKKSRNRRLMDSEELKPVLSFVNSRGNVKIKKALSDNEAAALISGYSNKVDSDYVRKEPTLVQNVKVAAGEDNENNPQLMLVSNVDENREDSVKESRRSQKMDLQKSAHRVIQAGKKELVFKPPKNKHISNLSVSFQVT